MTFLSLIPSVYTNVKQYGALGNGSTDDTTAITNALNSLSSTGGTLFFPPGTYITGNQTLLPNVHIVGAGLGNTTLKLKAGANTDLLSAQTGSINLSASGGSGSNGTLLSFSIRDLTLDGNKANQTSGTSYPLRFYGYNFILRDLQILNGYTGGCLIDWNGSSFIGEPSDEMESLIDNCKFHGNTGIGLQIGGPHDLRIQNLVSFNNSSHQYHFGPNLSGLQALNCHGYLSANTTNVATYLIEAGGTNFANCVAEGSFYTNVVILANDVSWIGGWIFGTAAEDTNERGIQFGQNSGQTPFPGQVNQSAGVTTSVSAAGSHIRTKIVNCLGGSLNFVNEGSAFIDANIWQPSGSAVVGTPSTSDFLHLQIGGPTADGTLGKGGGVQVVSAATAGFTVLDGSGNVAFQVSGFAPEGVIVGGSIATKQSSSAAAIASSGTITTSGIGVARVAPTGNVTGIIVQAGTTSGQQVVVLNESNFTLTLNTTPGTSNVADSASEPVIAALTARTYVWDGSTSRWYRSA